MQQELRFFQIGSAIGGNQEWFRDRMMYLGGCAAVTACDVYFNELWHTGHRRKGGMILLHLNEAA